MPLTARKPAGSVVAGLVPELWSSKVLDAVHMNLVIVPEVDHRWEPELTKGNIMNVGVLNTVVATEVVVGTAGTALDIATGSKKQITIDQWWEAPVVVDVMTLDQSQINIIEKGTREGGNAIAVKMDSTLAARFAALNGGIRLGVDGSAWTDDVVLAAMELLDEADVPETGRTWIVNPSVKRDLLTIDKFVRHDYVKMRVVPTGHFGMLYNAPVKMTNNLANATIGQFAALLHTDALAIIAQEKVSVAVVPEPLKHQTTVLSEALWGTQEMRNTFGVAIFTRSRA